MAKPKDAARAAKKQSSDSLWLPRTICAQLCKVSPSVFDFSLRPKLPQEHVKVEDNKTYFWAPAVVVAWAEYKGEGDGRKKNSSANDEHVQRKRAAEAEMMELELLKEKERVVSVEDWQERLSGQFWTVIENHGKTVKRAFGNEGVRYFNDLLAELRMALGLERDAG